MSQSGPAAGTRASVDDHAGERSLRDLMGLLALPALWVGRDGETVLQLMTEAVERLVPFRMSYVLVPLAPDTSPVTALRVDGRRLGDDEVAAWQEATEAWHRMPLGVAAVRPTGSPGGRSLTPIGELHVIRLNMGYSAGSGSVWFGSSSPDFPTLNQLTFLRAAASLAATGLQTARVALAREQASRAKDEFLAMLGHELRNPLAPIVTTLALIKRKGVNPLNREYAVIERQVAHLSRLVDDLLDVARITRGKVELKRKETQLALILTRALESVSPLLEERRHQVTIDVPADAIWVNADETRLIQVFANILTNAAKYTPPLGHIHVEARQAGDEVRVTVQDDEWPA
jgi:signal transduction histidine kinase